MEKAEAIARMQELVNRFNELSRDGKLDEFSEADVGSKFILPFLEALGWNIRDIDEVREQKRTLVGPVDYSLNVNKKPKVVVEIKKFSESLDHKRVVRGKEESYPEQAIRYAWHLRVDWVVLSNFAETRLYYSRVTRPESGLIFKLRYDKYLIDFDQLWIISKESVLSGKLDTYEKRRERRNVDEEILVDLFYCRKILAESIKRNNPSLDKDEIREIVQKILDRLLVIRVAEDKGILGSDSLWKELDAWKTRGLSTPFMRSLKSLFRDFDEVYNSKLFEEHKCEDVSIENKVLEDVITVLYKYNFDLISADVLGAIYEDYIGHVLTEEEKGIDIVKDYEKRKKAGIYYTPTHVVEYIIKRTIEEALQNKSIEEVSKIKILDPACGSGSFLIKAFDFLKEYYEKANKEEMKKSGAIGLARYTTLITDFEKKIIKNNLFGVDLDPQAAEIASVNIMLKALKKGEKLPLILGDNIKCGNSLVHGTEEELRQYFGDKWRDENPFDWNSEFPEIFREGGFDVVIGNPPHGAKLSEEERKYFSDKYEVGIGYKNSAALFIEKSFRLLKPDGLLGLVIPKSLTYSQKWGRTRDFILRNLEIIEIVDLSKAFPEVLLEQVILICKKKPQSKSTYLGSKLYGEERIESYEIPVELCKDLDALPCHIDPTSLKIYQKIRAKSILLREISHTFRGLPVQSKASEKHTENSEPLLRGDDIKPYFHGKPQIFIEKSALADEGGKIAQIKRPKVISQRIIAHVLKPIDHIIIMSTYDEEGLLNVDTVENTIVTNSKYDPKYVVAFLNSKLVAWYAYTFIFNKAVRTMDLDDYYIGKIPIYPAEAEDQKQIVNMVDKMLKLTRQMAEMHTKFEEYLNKFPRTEDIPFQNYYNRIPLENRIVVVPSNCRGLIKNIQIKQDGEWLVILVDGIVQDNGSEREVFDIEVLRIKIEDEHLRNFLCECIRSSKMRPSEGNILKKILEIKIPNFHRNREENLKIIKEIMESFIPAKHQSMKLIEEVSELENQINKTIYTLFGLNEKEIALIESTLPSGSIVAKLLGR
ncbi:MAG: N-6 DNA methylase [Candidatus Aenigmatarchaeota archaeon]